MSFPYQISSAEQYNEAYTKSVKDPEGFWADIATHFQWRKTWDRVLEWNFTEPRVAWFKGGLLNITENCLDRHLEKQGNTPALIWEPNDPEEHHRVLTYKELHFKVSQFAHVLKNNGVVKGDRVCIYMGMIPELAIALLACARIGAIHSVVFGGFSAQSIADRLTDAHAEYIITCDGAFRGGKDIPLKSVIDDALIGCPFVKKVIVCTRTRTPVSMIKGRDVWWEDEIKKVETQGNPDCPAEVMEAEDPLFILYTSGSTGKPKGVVHSTAGYMVWTNYTFVNVFQYQPGDVHCCTADIGWITGHSYIVYGPLSAGATSLMFEGIPTWPDAGRFWEIVQKHKVNVFYTAPTAIRSLMGFGDAPIAGKDLSSLKVLGTVGEPINEEAWHWYNEKIGHKRCPIVDTWWQTETGGVLISNMAGITPARPGYATLPMPGIQPVLVDEQGVIIPGSDAAEDALKPPVLFSPGTNQPIINDLFEHPDPKYKDRLAELVRARRTNPAEAEKLVWEQFWNFRFDSYKFRRQFIVGEYITDFICLSKKFIIDIADIPHQLADNPATDDARIAWFTAKGFTVLQFDKQDLMTAMPESLNRIEAALQALPDVELSSYLPDASPKTMVKGNLCIKFPWPGMLRTTYGDHERCRTTYFATYPNLYFTGDGALRDTDDCYRITGRVDDVLNVSGHRIGTAEVENAINMHAGVVESAVVGYPHDIKGQGIYAYIILSATHGDADLTRQDILQTVTRIIGPIAKPDKIQFVSGLPKTRSGKIMRRILRKIAEGDTENLGDTTTLLDPGVVETIKAGKL
jgi:acetyl-CoA synthetase